MSGKRDKIPEGSMYALSGEMREWIRTAARDWGRGKVDPLLWTGPRERSATGSGEARIYQPERAWPMHNSLLISKRNCFEDSES